MTNFFKKSLKLHKKLKGKLEIKSKTPLMNKKDLSLAYTPGVAEVSMKIAKNKELSYDLTLKGNSIAVLSDGSAVLGLGNIGPYAALPVMEGKAILFKEFANIDAYPVCLDTQNIEEIIKIVKAIAPGFAGINLEDISAPRCFKIEERLKKEINIPVVHDDQHGTAIVILAALINSLELVKKSIKKIKIVINGAGAAATATTNLLIKYGVPGENIVIVDSRGIIFEGRKDLNFYKRRLAKKTNKKKIKGNLSNAIILCDVFIGLSVADVLTKKMINEMAEDPIVFAMANPNPEISFKKAKKTKIKIFGTGRSDYPNQINNVLAFPGIFRGLLDVKAKSFTDKMKINTSLAIANSVSRKDLSVNFILPSPFSKRTVKNIAKAIQKEFSEK